MTRHPSQLSLAILPLGRRNEYQPKGVMPCGCGVKADMVREWVAGKTV